jgi:hypothetical protein
MMESINAEERRIEGDPEEDENEDYVRNQIVQFEMNNNITEK